MCVYRAGSLLSFRSSYIRHYLPYLMADSSRNTLPTGRRLRSSAQFRWMRLPTELRLMILEAITQQTCSDWAFAAAVCKEWQHFIEKRRFHRLKLKVPGLDNLERLGIRQRSLVRYISLDIELPTYTCRLCKRTESESWIQRNSSVISRGIWKLFRILSNWKPANGLTLGAQRLFSKRLGPLVQELSFRL